VIATAVVPVTYPVCTILSVRVVGTQVVEERVGGVEVDLLLAGRETLGVGEVGGERHCGG